MERTRGMSCIVHRVEESGGERKQEAEMAVKLSPGEKTIDCDLEPWFKPKKGGLIPPKKKLVKTMMLECLLKSIRSLFQSCCCPSGPPLSENYGSPSTIPSSQTTNSRKSKNRNKKAIFSISS